MVMESETPPVIIPTWLTGFDQLMPEGRTFPYKYLPRPGAELSVTFGNPIPADSIRQGLEACPPVADSGLDPKFVNKGEEPKGWLEEEVQRSLERRFGRRELERTMRTAEELSKIRARVTGIIHDAVQSLGRSVSSTLLHTPRQN